MPPYAGFGFRSDTPEGDVPSSPPGRMQNGLVEDLGIGTSFRTIRAELQDGFRIRKRIGLAFILVGTLIACVGGLFLGMFFYGDASGLAAGISIAVGLAIGAIGNLIWQRARILARRNTAEGEEP